MKANTSAGNVEESLTQTLLPISTEHRATPGVFVFAIQTVNDMNTGLYSGVGHYLLPAIISFLRIIEQASIKPVLHYERRRRLHQGLPSQILRHYSPSPQNTGRPVFLFLPPYCGVPFRQCFL